ncbi:MAG: Sec-independent protein translocase protein TatB [Xanthobacteraceae bacterium]
MFDISWTEFLLIGIVALIVIGPKELPAVMRSLGQWTRKIRSLAADFQNQFHEAMREAEMADLKKQVDDMASDIKQYDPLKDVRADVEAIGKDLDENVKSPDKVADQDAAKEAANTPDSAATTPPAEAFPIPQATAELSDKEVAGAGPVAPEAPAESTSSGGSGRPQ